MSWFEKRTTGSRIGGSVLGAGAEGSIMAGALGVVFRNRHQSNLVSALVVQAQKMDSDRQHLVTKCT